MTTQQFFSYIIVFVCLMVFNATFNNISVIQGATLTVLRLPGASEMRVRASENGTQLVQSGK
jgi:hypothetical protein